MHTDQMQAKNLPQNLPKPVVVKDPNSFPDFSLLWRKNPDLSWSRGSQTLGATLTGTLPPTGNFNPNLKASPSLFTHAKSTQSVNHDINTRVLSPTPRHACLGIKTRVFWKKIGSLSKGSVPVIFVIKLKIYRGRDGRGVCLLLENSVIIIKLLLLLLNIFLLIFVTKG